MFTKVYAIELKFRGFSKVYKYRNRPSHIFEKPYFYGHLAQLKLENVPCRIFFIAQVFQRELNMARNQGLDQYHCNIWMLKHIAI